MRARDGFPHRVRRAPSSPRGSSTSSSLSGEPLEAALLHRTNFYARFGLGREFDAHHEGWRRYVTGLRSAADGREWTYRYYLREPEARTAPRVEATFGCFSYELRAGNVVRLHFRNTDSDDRSPLDMARMERRRDELAALFAHLRTRISADTPIVGASWLYNLRAYRRLCRATWKTDPLTT